MLYKLLFFTFFPTVVIQCLGQLGYTTMITDSMKKLRNGKLTNRINKFIIFPKGEHEEFAKGTVGFINFRLCECVNSF